MTKTPTEGGDSASIGGVLWANNLVSGYRPDINGLRALAVLLVILFHLRIPGFDGGYIGVDLFFVISGYLITSHIIQSLANDTFTFAGFYRRRTRRLMPALFATIGACLIIGLFVYSPFELVDLAKESLFALLSISNFYFASNTGYFAESADTLTLLHTWSLGVEEQFYLVWPVLLFLFWKYLPKKYIGVFIFLTALTSFALNFNVDTIGGKSQVIPFLPQFNGRQGFFWMPFRIFQLALGGLIAFMPRNIPDRVREVMYVVALLGIGVMTYAFSGSTPFPGPNGLLVALCGVLLILGGQATYAPKLLSLGAFQWIGTRSYSLYLVHWPLIVFWIVNRPGGHLSIPAILFLFVLTFALGDALHRYVETRFRFQRQSNETEDHYSAYLFTAFLSLIVFILAIVTFDGIPARVDDQRMAEVTNFSGPINRYGGSEGCRGTCSVGFDEVGSISVVGDSHSKHLLSGFRNQLGDVKTTFYGQPGCFIVSATYANSGRCAKVRDRALERITNSDDPVVFAHRWTKYRNERITESETGKQVKYRDSRKLAAIVAGEINKTASELDPDQQVIAIGSVPEYRGPYGVESCFFSPFDRKKECSESFIPNSDATVRFNTVMKAELDPSITFIDPFDSFCRKKGEKGYVCANVMQNGETVYIDSSHLSQAAAQKLIQDNKTVFMAAIQDEEVPSS